MTTRRQAQTGDSAADVLRRVLAAIEHGEMDSPRRVTDHLRGALTALEAVESSSSFTASERLR